MATDAYYQIAALENRIRELEDQVQFLYKHLGIFYGNEATTNADSRVIEALRKGNKIEAIRIYREIYNTGLAEAKTAVEGLLGRMGT
jgi:ribosomal protein L7/L12